MDASVFSVSILSNWPRKVGGRVSFYRMRLSAPDLKEHSVLAGAGKKDVIWFLVLNCL